jgi:PDDEXK-like domain of unknown function (DUF3799)
MTRIDRAGIYTMSPETYHSDPVATSPSLSSSIAKLLLQRSPLHAWHQSSRLNPAYEQKSPTEAMEHGAIVHKLFLGAGAEIVECDADDWRGKDARMRRVEAREAGKLPVLSWKLPELERCAEAAREQIKAYPEIASALSAGKPERAVIWQEDATWCRALVDWLPDDPRAPLIDLKTTRESAAPQSWERRLISEYAVQAALYVRGITSVRGQAPDGMRFLVIETDAPYAMSVIAPSPSLMALANEMVDEALETWRECLRTDRWPGYPPHTAWVDAPGWALAQREERQLRAEWMREQRATDGEVYQQLMQAAGGPPR